MLDRLNSCLESALDALGTAGMRRNRESVCRADVHRCANLGFGHRRALVSPRVLGTGREYLDEVGAQDGLPLHFARYLASAAGGYDRARPVRHGRDTQATSDHLWP